nr:MAG TPA: hypothetical protein [Caudoviricetes sp.]
MRRPCSAPAAGASSSRSSTASRRRAGRQSRFSTIPSVSRRSQRPSQRPKRPPTIPRRGCVSRRQSCGSYRTSLIWCPQLLAVKSRTRARYRRSSWHSRTRAPTAFMASEMKR